MQAGLLGEEGEVLFDPGVVRVGLAGPAEDQARLLHALVAVQQVRVVAQRRCPRRLHLSQSNQKKRGGGDSVTPETDKKQAWY